MSEGWMKFGPYLKELARGPRHLSALEPEVAEEAMKLVLAGAASPAQIGGFFLVGRAKGDTPAELAAFARAMRAFVHTIEVPFGPPVVTVAGGFDGKLRTFNVGAAASLVAAAAGGRVALLAAEQIPPKEGRTVLDALRNIGVAAPDPLRKAGELLGKRGFVALSPEEYLPEMHRLLPLRREMARRTSLNVLEKFVGPVPAAHPFVGVTHRLFLRTIPETLLTLGVERALVAQTIEGSDEAPLDGASSLVLISRSRSETHQIEPESLGLGRATKTDVPWRGMENEAGQVREALGGERGPVLDLILYNAALRLWVAGEGGADRLAGHVDLAREAVSSGTALRLLGELTRNHPPLRSNAS